MSDLFLRVLRRMDQIEQIEQLRRTGLLVDDRALMERMRVHRAGEPITRIPDPFEVLCRPSVRRPGGKDSPGSRCQR